jgi:primosomal protein N'
MKIKEIVSQSRRDFWADMECEHCGHIEKKVSGYDDTNYHNNVIPDMKCKECGKKGSEEHRPLAPKYPEGMQL